MTELTPGLELGARFVLVRRIGRGGSAEVWLAVDRSRNERVALKFLDEEFAGDAGRVARLEAEVAAARNLPPEHVVAVHGLERVDGRPHGQRHVRARVPVGDRVDVEVVDPGAARLERGERRAGERER